MDAIMADCPSYLERVVATVGKTKTILHAYCQIEERLIQLLKPV
jgi:hypothetical protein